MIQSDNHMKEQLPEISLIPGKFAREIGVSTARLTRVVNSMDPPLSLDDGKIPVSEYPRLLDMLLNEPRQITTNNS